MLSALRVRMELFDLISEILCLIVFQRITILLSPKLPEGMDGTAFVVSKKRSDFEHGTEGFVSR
jgi:hypothetical protein